MENVASVVWQADTLAPGVGARRAGGLVGASLIPAALILCAQVAAGGLGPALGLSLLLVPVAAVFAVRELRADRHAVVMIELAGGEFTLTRTDRSRVTVPAREVRRIEVLRTLEDGRPRSARMRLHLGDGVVEHTRTGPGALPDGWAEAVAIAEVGMTVTERHRSGG